MTKIAQTTTITHDASALDVCARHTGAPRGRPSEETTMPKKRPMIPGVDYSFTSPGWDDPLIDWPHDEEATPPARRPALAAWLAADGEPLDPQPVPEGCPCVRHETDTPGAVPSTRDPACPVHRPAPTERCLR